MTREEIAREVAARHVWIARLNTVIIGRPAAVDDKGIATWDAGTHHMTPQCESASFAEQRAARLRNLIMVAIREGIEAATQIPGDPPVSPERMGNIAALRQLEAEWCTEQADAAIDDLTAQLNYYEALATWALYEGHEGEEKREALAVLLQAARQAGIRDVVESIKEQAATFHNPGAIARDIMKAAESFLDD